MSEEERAGMIATLSVMNFKDEQYYSKMSDREICEEYDRLMQRNEG